MTYQNERNVTLYVYIKKVVVLTTDRSALIIKCYYFQVPISPFNFSKTFSTVVPDTIITLCRLFEPYKRWEYKLKKKKKKKKKKIEA